MSSIVIAGDTSGSVTLQAPAVAGATVITLPSTSTTLVSSQWTTASSDIYYTTGNVGIGTTSPATKLHVSTSSGSEVLRIESTSNPLFTIYNAGTREFYIQTQSVIDLWGQANKAMRFGTNDIERLRITSAGDVGIGTTSPSAKLDVAGSAYVRGDSTNGTFTGPGQLAIKRSSGDPVLSFHGNTGTQIGNIQFQDAGTCTIGVNVNQALAFTTNSTERVRITSAGNVGIGTSSPAASLHVVTTAPTINTLESSAANGGYLTFSNGSTVPLYIGFGSTLVTGLSTSDAAFRYSNNVVFGAGATERARITSAGTLFIGRTSDTDGAGLTLEGSGFIRSNRDGGTPMVVNRNTDDGTLVSLRQAGAEEGSISVSGTTVSFNGGHLSRWSQLPDGSKDESIVKGTVMSNLDDMCVWEKDGVVAENEQLNKMKVSDVEGDTSVAGVFVNWTMDEQYDVDDMNVAMTGDMIIRIANGVVVQKGDLLMSAGDGTAKPQGDDIVRSKTVAKVTSNHITCTYADGSYCVPCVLMAC